MSEEKEELYSAKLPAGKRTYFFDVKESTDTVRYLTITESRRKGKKEFERHRVMVFQENALAFNEEIGRALRWILEDAESAKGFGDQPQNAEDDNGWTKEEEDTLRREYVRLGERPTIDELAALFHRKPSAIRSKLEEMGLL
ncbi:MAG: DUF3276 family protein [candidate division Zixibacteria bacterium]|nr:DUF3276 family protein [candidate division Zixibacteria bacterium]